MGGWWVQNVFNHFWQIFLPLTANWNKFYLFFISDQFLLAPHLFFWGGGSQKFKNMSGNLEQIWFYLFLTIFVGREGWGTVIFFRICLFVLSLSCIPNFNVLICLEHVKKFVFLKIQNCRMIRIQSAFGSDRDGPGLSSSFSLARYQKLTLINLSFS